MKLRVFSLAALLSLLFGCAAMVGTAPAIRVPEDSADRCEQHCNSIGLELSAVAIMANNVGCVCQKRAASAASGSGAVAAGMATIMLAEQQARQQQQQRQHQQRMYR